MTECVLLTTEAKAGVLEADETPSFLRDPWSVLAALETQTFTLGLSAP